MASFNKVILLEEQFASMYKSGMSTTQISKQNGVSMYRVRIAIRKHTQLRSRSEGIRLASERISASRTGLKRPPFSASHRRRISESRKKYGVGITKKPNGYIESTKGKTCGKSVHRLVMELSLGRTLSRNEVVHHIDRNKTNNSIENLQLMTRSAHTSLHRREGK